MSGGYKTVPADTYNPFGMRNTPNTAGYGQSQALIGDIGNVLPQAQASANANAATLTNLGNETASGAFLNGSSALTRQYNAILGQANRQSADQSANIKGQFQRNGMEFSTANQEAEESNAANNRANALNTATNLLGNNYQAERGYQNNAGNILTQAQQMYFNPLQSAAGTLDASMGGPYNYMNPTMIQQPGAIQYLSALAGAAGTGAKMAAM